MRKARKLTATQLPPGVARKRYRLFLQYKVAPMSANMSVTSMDDHLRYDIDGFLELLKKVLDEDQEVPVQGMKMYFSCYNSEHAADRGYIPPGKQNQLSFVFVPTIEKGNTKKWDKPGVYYLMVLDAQNKTVPQQVSLETADHWVRYYRETAILDMPDETQNLWYSRELLEYMRTNVKDGMTAPTPTIEEMIFCFGMHQTQETIEESYNGPRRMLPISEHLTGTFLFGKDVYTKIKRKLSVKDEADAADWIRNHRSRVPPDTENLSGDDVDGYDTAIPNPPGTSLGGDTLPLP